MQQRRPTGLSLQLLLHMLLARQQLQRAVVSRLLVVTAGSGVIG